MIGIDVREVDGGWFGLASPCQMSLYCWPAALGL
jgi:hypothetical protein